MFPWLRSIPRHPLFPRLQAAPAAKAAGWHASLTGNFQELAQAARQGARVERALFLLIEQGAPLPSGTQRDQLWKWFEVPCYVLLVNANGKVIAYECEAQDGLHLVGRRPKAGDDESALCPCGRPGPKIARENDQPSTLSYPLSAAPAAG